MGQNTLVKNSPREEILDKISKLNKEAENAWKLKMSEARREDIKKNLFAYYKIAQELARKWHGVWPGTWSALCDNEKNVLCDMMLPQARKLRIRIRFLHLIVPAISAFILYVGNTIPSQGDFTSICVIGFVIGLIISIKSSFCIESLPFLKFIRYHKLCFPDEERSGDGPNVAP